MTSRTLLIAIAATMLPAAASAQSAIPRSVMAGGGTRATSTNYAARATVGQAVVGASASAAYRISSGYWFNPCAIVSGIGDPPPVPLAFALEQNFPNPFNPTTTIAFSLPVAAWVRLGVYDVTGAEVLRAVDRSLPSGRHRVTLNAGRLASGVYFYRIEAGGFRESRKLVLLK
jgi:hypothetical protein